mgnify:CR=1 FL=1
MTTTEKKAFALALGVGYGLSAPAFADLVILRSGERLEGNVSSQTISAVNFVGDDGTVQLLPKSTISTIFYFSRTEDKAQQIKLVALKKEEEKKKREEELKKKREEDRKRREEELKEKREQELQKSLEEKTETGPEKLSPEELRRQKRENENDLQRRRQEALRLERTTGKVRLWSGQEISARIVERKGNQFTLETPAGFMDFDRSEIEQMEITSTINGSPTKRVLGPQELEAVKTESVKDDALNLSSGMDVQYRTVSYDGYNTEVQSDLGNLQLRPADMGVGYSRESRKSMDLQAGQYGFVMLRSGQKLEGDLMLRGKHSWVIRTESGEIHLDPEEIIFSAEAPRPEGGFFSSLAFWK